MWYNSDMTTFRDLPIGAEFSLPNDPSNALLRKDGPTTYYVVFAEDDYAVGLTCTGVNPDAEVTS